MPSPEPSPPLVFTREAIREVDRRCIHDFGIPGIVLMENAASALANRALAMIESHNCDSAIIAAGPGNNGGDGFALARKLSNAGINITILQCADPERIAGDARTNRDIAAAMRIPIQPFDTSAKPDNALIIDALLGTGITSAPRGDIATAIDWINNAGLPVLAVDIPSGMDCDTGEPLGPIITAQETVTFVGWKQGFTNPGSRRYTGAITVGDIGAPIQLTRELASPIHPD